MTKSEKNKFKRALKKCSLIFLKYNEIVEKRNLSVSKENRLQMYQSILNAAKTYNTDNLIALYLQLESMYNKCLLSNEYLIKSQI